MTKQEKNLHNCTCASTVFHRRTQIVSSYGCSEFRPLHRKSDKREREGGFSGLEEMEQTNQPPLRHESEYIRELAKIIHGLDLGQF